MKIYISQKEYDSFSKKLFDLEKEREKLQKMLGKIMENSGSSASKTPGFNETEDQIKILNKKILDTKNLLSQSKIIKDLSELKENEVTIYSLVSVLDANTNKEIRYYVQNDFSESKNGYTIVTPLSPIGKCLMGKKIKEKTKIELPKGNLELEIIGIEKKFL